MKVTHSSETGYRDSQRLALARVAPCAPVAAGISQGEAMILQSLTSLERCMAFLADQLETLKQQSSGMATKDWYTTAELAEMMGVTGHTVRERWCNQGRLECSKNPDTGKWRIPGREYERLRRGGRPDGI